MCSDNGATPPNVKRNRSLSLRIALLLRRLSIPGQSPGGSFAPSPPLERRRKSEKPLANPAEPCAATRFRARSAGREGDKRGDAHIGVCLGEQKFVPALVCVFFPRQPLLEGLPSRLDSDRTERQGKRARPGSRRQASPSLHPPLLPRLPSAPPASQPARPPGGCSTHPGPARPVVLDPRQKHQQHQEEAGGRTAPRSGQHRRSGPRVTGRRRTPTSAVGAEGSAHWPVASSRLDREPGEQDRPPPSERASVFCWLPPRAATG